MALTINGMTFNKITMEQVNFVKENGYKYLIIYESELINAKQKIEEFLIGFPQQ
jgi:hypothetical protein